MLLSAGELTLSRPPPPPPTPNRIEPNPRRPDLPAPPEPSSPLLSSPLPELRKTYDHNRGFHAVQIRISGPRPLPDRRSKSDEMCPRPVRPFPPSFSLSLARESEPTNEQKQDRQSPNDLLRRIRCALGMPREEQPSSSSPSSSFARSPHLPKPLTPPRNFPPQEFYLCRAPEKAFNSCVFEKLVRPLPSSRRSPRVLRTNSPTLACLLLPKQNRN